MLLFWYIVLMCCAVKSDHVGNNYYIIEMPDGNIAKEYNTPFKVYWNVPTKQCKSKKIPFNNLEKFGIIQNENDVFQGEKITILYNPGAFPCSFEAHTQNCRKENGRLPQEGNLELHLTEFRENLTKLIPNPDFSGVGIIDFEAWRPIYQQLYGKMTPYKDLSMEMERQRHSWWPESWQKMELTKRFEDAARVFMQATLSLAKLMRPKAIWGYYGFPHCFNMDSEDMIENCSKTTRENNDKAYWLWAESTALYPSVYSSSDLSTAQLAALVRGRVTEANRVKKDGALVLPYFGFTYRDGGFIKEEDVIAIFEALQVTNASGLIIWGGSNEVNQIDKCEHLYTYVETILGPITHKYIKKINRIYDDTENVEHEEDSNDISKSDSDVVTTAYKSNKDIKNYVGKTVIDPKLTLLSQTEYSKNISHKTDANKIDFNTTNGIHEEKLYNCLDTILGPIIQKYVQQIKYDKRDPKNKNSNVHLNSANDVTATVTSTLNTRNRDITSEMVKSGIDQDLAFSPYKNSSDETSNAEQEQLEKYFYETDNKEDSNPIVLTVNEINKDITNDLISSTVNEIDKEKLYNCVDTILGPIIQKYVREIKEIYDERDAENKEDSDVAHSANNNTTTVTSTLGEENKGVTNVLKEETDQERVFLPQKNYSGDIHILKKDNLLIVSPSLNNNKQTKSENLKQHNAASNIKLTPTTEMFSNAENSVNNETYTETILAQKIVTDIFEVEQADVLLTNESTIILGASTDSTTNFAFNDDNDYLITVNASTDKLVTDIFIETVIDDTDTATNNITDDLVTLTIKT